MTSQARTPFVIGIAGGTGAGKTTVTRRLVDSADADRLTVVPLDAYYRDRSGDDERRRAGDDYDHPDAFDWPLLLDHVRALRAGRDVEMPVYDFTRHARERSRRPVKAAPVVVVEGILALHDATLRAQFDLTVFVDADPDVRLIRRLRRDVAERGRTAESVIAQYLATVRPAHLRFVEPTRRYADVVVQNDDRIDRAVELLAARLHAFLDAGRS